MRSVGVMGDERTYDYAVALRAVKTIDFMTAESAELPYEVLNKVMNRIINEVKAVSYTHLRAHETKANIVCHLLLEKKKKKNKKYIRNI